MIADGTLFDKQGRRLYLTADELDRFFAAAEDAPPRERIFCHVLARTGGRISEILALKRRDIDQAAKAINIRSLKKRSKRHHRAVPVPPSLICDLNLVFDLKRGRAEDWLWEVDVRTANRWVTQAIRAAGLDYHTPRSLRHTFATLAIVKGVPITAVQKWLGHSDLKTTSIYAQVMGAEERSLAERMWS